MDALKKGCGMRGWGRIKFQPRYETQIWKWLELYLVPNDTCLLNRQKFAIRSIMAEAKH